MGGTPIGRGWVVMMHNGVAAIDWGGGIFQDAVTGDFFHAAERDVSHRADDLDLDWLKRLGRVDDYDPINVYFYSLPEYFKRTID